MSITASCHHKLKDWEDLGVPVEYEGETRDCQPCTVYATFCVDCALKYLAEGRLLNVAEAANEIRQRVADLE